MYVNSVEIYFFEDEKTVSFTFCADTIEKAKDHNVEDLVAHAGQQYSMMESEVVVSSVITDHNEYVDSDEYFCTYKPPKTSRHRELATA